MPVNWRPPPLQIIILTHSSTTVSIFWEFPHLTPTRVTNVTCTYIYIYIYIYIYRYINTNCSSEHSVTKTTNELPERSDGYWLWSLISTHFDSVLCWYICWLHSIMDNYTISTNNNKALNGWHCCTTQTVHPITVLTHSEYSNNGISIPVEIIETWQHHRSLHTEHCVQNL